MSTLTTDTSHASELGSAAYAFCVTGLDGACASAIIWPTSLTPMVVSGVVEWQDPICMSSIFCTEGDPSVWMQRIFAVYAAAGPTSTRHVPALAAQSWATFWATFPDPDGDAQSKVRISLCRARWQATFSSTSPGRLTVHLPISEALRDLDAGSVLLEMGSRIAVQQTPSLE